MAFDVIGKHGKSEVLDTVEQCSTWLRHEKLLLKV